MRITRAVVDSVAAEFPQPLRFAPEPMTINEGVVLRVEDAAGAVGLGYAPTFGFGTEAVRSLIAADFAPRIIDLDLDDAIAAVGVMAAPSAIAGRLAGAAAQALAILEMALLDVEGQLAGQPLHRMWGLETGPVPAYASGGWRHFDIDELCRFVSQRVSEGFSAVKVQVGLSPVEDATRLRAVRESIDSDIDLMLDANNRIPLQDVPEWVAALAPFDPLWLEDPLVESSHKCLEELRRQSPLRLAAGENETEPGEVEDLLLLGVVDVIQPDVFRIGMTATCAVRAAALGKRVVVSPHMAHEPSVHVVSGLPGCWVEFFDWFQDWWEVPVLPVAGTVTPSTDPGHGLRLRPGWLDSHRLGPESLISSANSRR